MQLQLFVNPSLRTTIVVGQNANVVGNHEQGHGTLREEEVIEAMEAVKVEVAAKVVQVVGLFLKGSMLLGTVQQKAATLE